jgi:protoporphyrinogen oxidase
MNLTRQTLVVGGGISGLTAARTIRDLGRECLLLEQCPSLGGLTRTVEVGNFCFDYTGHFLHLSRYKTPAEIPYAGLDDNDWQRIERRSCCFVAGRLIDAPIQYNLGQLPPETLRQCVESYNARPAASGTAVTFRDYVVTGFGQYLADLFLIPQNEKTMAVSLDCLSSQAVKRFFPPPNQELVQAGIQGEVARVGEYNSKFWYPRKGGIGSLVQGLAAGLPSAGVCTGQPVIAIDLENRQVQTAGGQIFAWDQMFTSMPLKSLCHASNEPDLKRAAQELSHSSTVSFNIGLKGTLPVEFEGVHWIYVPDRSVPFYRVGFYSNISQGTCTPGHSALYVEVGVPGEDVDQLDLVKDLQPQVIAALEGLGWIDSRKVECVAIHVLRHAYVHHTQRSDHILKAIFERLHKCHIYPIGRYGLWDYTSMEDSMESASSTVREVFNGLQYCDSGPQRSASPGELGQFVSTHVPAQPAAD